MIWRIFNVFLLSDDRHDAILAVRTDYGFWSEAEKTMVWSSKQNDGQGHFVGYLMTEEFKGDTRVFTFSQLGLAKPNPHPLVKLVFTKRKAQSLVKSPLEHMPP